MRFTALLFALAVVVKLGNASLPSEDVEDNPQLRRRAGGSKSINHRGDDFCTKKDPCDRCEGDCDEDDQCKGKLKCWQKDEREHVPGCSGGGSDKSSKFLLELLFRLDFHTCSYTR